VENPSDVPVRVHVLVEALVNGKWVWNPGAPGKNKSWLTHTLKPKEKRKLRLTEKTSIRGRKVRMWAETEDKKHSWTEYKDKDLLLISKPYRALTVQSKTVRIPLLGDPPPSPEELLIAAHELRVDSKLAEARKLYEQFVTLYPETSGCTRRATGRRVRCSTGATTSVRRWLTLPCSTRCPMATSSWGSATTTWPSRT
jgi:hypothetical protein